MRAAKPPAHGRLMLWDGAVKHFGVRITPNGVKSYVVLLGSGRRQVIGHFPVITLAEAREKAKRILAERTLGRHQTASTSWQSAVQKFIDVCEVKNRSSTHTEYARVLGKYFPFGTMRLSDISKQDIARKLEKLNRTPSQQAHSLVICKMLFRWALVQGYVDVDPAAGFRRARQKKRGRVLTEDELQKIWVAAIEQGYPHGTIVRLLSLTGQRRGEIAALHRSWINSEERTVTLPASVTKNGMRRKLFDIAKGGSAPIASEALDRIAALYAIEKTIRGKSADERRAVRQEKSKPLVQALKIWLEQQFARVSTAKSLATSTPVLKSASVLISLRTTGIFGVVFRVQP